MNQKSSAGLSPSGDSPSALPEAVVSSMPSSFARERPAAAPRERALAAIVERNRRLELQNRHLLLSIRQLSRLAYVDPLTRLANRRCFETQISSEIHRACRGRTALALALCDVDSLKYCNDTFGHQCGDEVLQRLGEIMCGYARRGGDLAARYGGDEFALLLPAAGYREALGIAERLRREVATSPMRFGIPQQDARITVSVGLTVYPGTGLCEPADVVGAADRALYRAKEAGRNCTRYQHLQHSFS